MNIGIGVTMASLCGGVLFWGSLPQTAWCGEADERESIRQEIRQMRHEYESRLSALEARLAALDGSKTSGTEAVTTAFPPRQAPATSLELPQTQPFEFHGYLRSGFGTNGKGGDMEAFRAPGADAKYRLGNERETYGELLLAHNWLKTGPAAPTSGAPTFTTQVRVAFLTKNHQGYDPTDQFTLREAYSETEKVGWTSDLKFWAGERFYDRRDIHINDFYVFDMSGYGGGAENIPLGPLGNLSLAYIGGSTDNYEFDSLGRVAKNSLDMRLYSILPEGKAMFWLVPSYLAGGSTTNTSGLPSKYNSTAGLAAGFLHKWEKPLGLENSFNQFTVQYGYGAMSNFTPVVQFPTPDLRDSWTSRVTESAVLQFSDDFSMMPAFIWQMQDTGAKGNSRIDWLSAGIRPIYNFSEHTSLAVELGVDYVDNGPLGVRDYLFKATVAPQISLGRLFFSRPVLRIFGTYAQWGKGFEGLVGGSAYRRDTAGTSFGLQTEAWW
jgi:maltoporin